MLEIINKIRADPKSYAEVIEDSIQNIIEVQNNANDSPKIIYFAIIKYLEEEKSKSSFS